MNIVKALREHIAVRAAVGKNLHAREHGQMGTGRAKHRSILLAGDSITAQLYDTAGTPSAIVDNGNGTATITLPGSHNFAVGSRVYVSSAPDIKFNTFGAAVTAIVNTNPYTVTYTLDTGTSKPVVVGTLASDTIVGHTKRYTCIGWPAWLEFLVGAKLNFVPAFAGGADTGQILTMLNNAAAANSFDRIMIAAGMNDIYARGWTFAAAQASLKALIDGAVGYGKPVTVFTVPPRNSSLGGWTSGKQAVHNQLNVWMHAYCAAVGADFADTWRAQHNGTTWVNSGAANPDPTTGFTSATDGTHPLNIGAYAFANSTPASVKAAFPPAYVAAHVNMDDYSNVLPNRKLTGTAGTKTAGSGTINGTAPDSWTIEITSGTPTITLTSPARTVAADGDADGNNLQAVFSYSGSGTQIFRLINTSSIHASVTAGEVRDIEFPVTITGATGMTGMELVLFGTKSSGGNENIGFTGTSQSMAGSFSGVLRIKDWTVPSGLTSLIVFPRFYFTSGGATIVFGKPRFVISQA